MSFEPRQGRQAISFRGFCGDRKGSRYTSRNRDVELHIPIFVCQRGPACPTERDQAILHVSHMDLYTDQRWLVVIDQPIAIRVDPGPGRTMPGAVGGTVYS